MTQSTADATPHAHEALVEDHLHLVHAIARGWRSRCRSTIEHDDLVQAGTIGLMEAAGRYDPSVGLPFAAFASRRIRGAICDLFRERDPLTRGRRSHVRSLDAARGRLGSLHGREPTREELAHELGWTREQLEEVLCDASALTRGWATVCSDEHAEPAVSGSCPTPATPFENLARSELRDELASAIAGLPERERLVISLYYQDDETMTMAEIGAALGVTESRVSQLHSRAVARLRSALAERGAGPVASAIG